jgi:hypothetical protein
MLRVTIMTTTTTMTMATVMMLMYRVLSASGESQCDTLLTNVDDCSRVCPRCFSSCHSGSIVLARAPAYRAKGQREVSRSPCRSVAYPWSAPSRTCRGRVCPCIQKHVMCHRVDARTRPCCPAMSGDWVPAANLGSCIADADSRPAACACGAVAASNCRDDGGHCVVGSVASAGPRQSALPGASSASRHRHRHRVCYR